jgi:acylphosphatase
MSRGGWVVKATDESIASMTGSAHRPSPDDFECRLLRIEGRVQGVGYREACVQRARELGLAGYVRNRRDGSVEVMLQGPADAVARVQAWLHEGPPLARVDRVTRSTLPAPVALLDDFERRPTE